MNTKALPKILLVEDDDIDAEVVRRGLKEHNVESELVRAENGYDALDLIQGTNGVEPINSPYVVFLDLNMPQMDGLEFLETLRSLPDYTDTVVFVLTTSNDQEDKATAFKYNIAGYFLKSEVGKCYKQFIEMTVNYLKLTEFPTKLKV